MRNLPDKMKAIVAYSPGDYRLEDVELPKVLDDEILIRVKGCGICGSDIKTFEGAKVFWGDENTQGFIKAPMIPGHEFYGTIVDLGDSVAEKGNFAVGDSVISEMIIPCRECKYCKNGQYWMCQISNTYGFQSEVNGAMAEYMKFPSKANVFKLPDDMPFESAVLIEPFSCAAHAVDRATITPEDVVVISGLGPIGLGMVGSAKKFNPKLLIGLDLQKNRTTLGKKFGCDIVLNPKEVNVVEEILKLTDGYGCDVYMEASASPASVVQGLNAIRKLGRFVVISVFGENISCDWSIISDRKELNVLGSHLAPYCYPKVINGLSTGLIPHEGVVTHQFPLSLYKKAFETVLNDKSAIKVVLIP